MRNLKLQEKNMLEDSTIHYCSLFRRTGRIAPLLQEHKQNDHKWQGFTHCPTYLLGYMQSFFPAMQYSFLGFISGTNSKRDSLLVYRAYII